MMLFSKGYTFNIHVIFLFKEEIKSQPMCFDKLAKYMRRRIAAKSELTHLSVEDQQMLVSLILHPKFNQALLS